MAILIMHYFLERGMKKLCKFLFSRYFICAVFIAAEIALLVPSIWLSDNPQLLLLFSTPPTVVATVELINRNVNPESKVTWLIVILFLPYVGVVLYILFSKRRTSGWFCIFFFQSAEYHARRRVFFRR